MKIIKKNQKTEINPVDPDTIKMPKYMNVGKQVTERNHQGAIGKMGVIVDCETLKEVSVVPQVEFKCDPASPSRIRSRMDKLRVLTNEDRQKMLLNNREQEIYDPSYHPIAAYRLCSIYGSTDQEVCEFFDIGMNCLYDWKEYHREFKDMIQKGKDLYDSCVVENSLRDCAIGGTRIIKKKVPMKVRIDKDQDEIQIVEVEQEIVIPPNLNAVKFWLDKRSKRWNNDIDKGEKNTVQSTENLDNLSIDELQQLRYLMMKARSSSKSIQEAEVCDEM